MCGSSDSGGVLRSGSGSVRAGVTERGDVSATQGQARWPEACAEAGSLLQQLAGDGTDGTGHDSDGLHGEQGIWGKNPLTREPARRE
jgi:hypothetical protein